MKLKIFTLVSFIAMIAYLTYKSSRNRLYSECVNAGGTICDCSKKYKLEGKCN